MRNDWVLENVRDEVARLERGASALLDQVPMMARAMYPEFVQAAQDHIQALSDLRKELEKSS